MNKLMSAFEVATYLGISKRSLESLLARGDGPRFIKIGNLRRWQQEELVHWTLQKMEERPMEGAPS
ncbi:MAG: helix-turn-helix domain-containing protein [Gammaproteobacteria bacterium]|nr:helix-turn-helix domain-containing protein [Gammaproteobacteria bacterium]MBU0786866.1 helix-turn-helix domain-containing protein [Gammaproteobacteria bacterium]MBU0813928.1 helix-turn-helix domain-containing protein [Gammaproteobacteria bacterium]MBU1788599.1 helix-turn-helix domain-containing protein [Gammaproteobacteria bacterium]